MMKRIAEGVSRIFLACGLSKYSDNVAEQICANLSMDYVQVYVSASKNDVDIITENLLYYTTPCFEALTFYDLRIFIRCDFYTHFYASLFNTQFLDLWHDSFHPLYL